jgi:hypothetical protein
MPQRAASARNETAVVSVFVPDLIPWKGLKRRALVHAGDDNGGAVASHILM